MNGGRAFIGPKAVFVDQGVRLAADLFMHTRTLRRPGLTVQLIECAGVERDMARVLRASATDLPPAPANSLTVVLDGRYESSTSPATESGRLTVEARRDWLEHWSGTHQRMIVVMGPAVRQVDGGTEHLGPTALATWRHVADLIASTETAERALDAAVTAATHAGLRMAKASDAPAPPEVCTVARAMSRSLTTLHANPQACDLEEASGYTARHLRRVMQEHPEWLSPLTFRTRLRLLRALYATSLLAAKVAGDEVTAALGYGSSRALYTALRRAGIQH